MRPKDCTRYLRKDPNYELKKWDDDCGLAQIKQKKLSQKRFFYLKVYEYFKMLRTVTVEFWCDGKHIRI